LEVLIRQAMIKTKIFDFRTIETPVSNFYSNDNVSLLVGQNEGRMCMSLYSYKKKEVIMRGIANEFTKNYILSQYLFS
jgi:hypothetical protein